MKNILLILLLLTTQTFSKVVIISDLDDTVRRANITDITDAVRRHVKGVKPFEHMSVLYHQIKENYEAQGEVVEFHYLSGSHRYYYNAKKWLDKYQFPKGKTYQKRFTRDGNTFEFKTKKVKEILGLEAFTGEAIKVLFFGDNGQYDAAVYSQIANDFMINDFHIFIRDVMATEINLSTKLPALNPLENTFYFLSEKDLFAHEIFSFLSNDIITIVSEEARAGVLVPTFIIDNIENRIGIEICKKIEGFRKRRTCHKNKDHLARLLVKQYLTD